jgi:Carboxypeptidase regulatory-like domain
MQKLSWVLGVSLLVSTALFGQTTSLTGTVTDPTGAVVPSATISIANVQTGAQRDVTSDNQGRYTIPQLTPGTYKLSARASGFSDVVINNLELLVNQPATVPITFEKVGTTTTTVTVEATGVQVNTTDASLGNAISTQAIIEMPMYARNVAGLLAFQPGVTSFGSFGAQNLDYRSGSVNGGKSDQSNITLDGADVADQNTRAAFTSVLRVTLDSVEEFRTVTTNGDAATGRGSGADIQLVTKSGTNDIHGSLYEYRRGTETAANSFFSNRSRVARAPLLINIFGGSVGGAIKKNRLFYFLNYEGRRDASAVSVTRTVPTESLKQGIITYHKTDGTLAQVGPAGIKGIDPAGIGISPAALKDLQSLFPVGNNTAIGDQLNTTGYTFNAPGHAVQNTYIAKFDYHLSDRHSVFIRGNLQNDSADNGAANAPQFPGLPANAVSLANSKGLAAGWTGVLTPSFVSTFRYGFTRAGNQSTGVETTNFEWFRGFDTPYGTSTGLSRIVPVHNLSQDFSWNHGAHDIRFGAVVRLISNSSLSYGHSFSSASSNPSWLKGSGSDLSPASLGLTRGDTQSFQYAMGALLGLEVQGNANYNYLVDGTLITPGLPVARDFVNHEGELYIQDTWKATRNLTITAGLRFTLAPPVYEANGQQASTNIPLADWLAKRATLADQGLSQAGAGLITFVPLNQGRPMYPFHKSWAPRLGLAYSPKAESGLSKFFFGGPGKTSIRAGAGMYYDVLGQPLAQTFNATAFGLASTLTSPPNILSTAQAPRYNGFFAVPSSIVPSAPSGGLPRTYPTSGAGSFAITNSIDDKLKAPYTINLDFSIGRELGHGFYVQGSYVGRLSRHSLVNQDLAMPTNLKDPKSGQTYFQAMTQLATLLDLQGVSIANLPKIPFFENMWSKAAGNGLTATQVWANDYLNNSNTGDFTNTLNNADNSGNCNTSGTTFVKGIVDSMACGDLGPFSIFSPQFSALSTYSSIGLGNYHAMQWTLRKRFSNGLLFDLNYTWSKSIDLGSTSESGGSFSGFIQNTWNASQMRGVSTYDTTHAVNAYFVYQLPLGRGRKFGSGMNRILDAIVGGWQINGTYRQTSGLPFSVGNGQRWPTNWEVSDIATPNGTPIPSVVSTGNATGLAGPNLWQDPKAAFASFQETMAGQSGSRNTLRGDGFFNIDTGLYKTFTMPYSEHHKLTFRWEAYNVTNSVRFDPACGGTGGYGTGCANTLSASSFGKLNTQLGTPRQMQFAMRYSF